MFHSYLLSIVFICCLFYYSYFVRHCSSIQSSINQSTFLLVFIYILYGFLYFICSSFCQLQFYIYCCNWLHSFLLSLSLYFKSRLFCLLFGRMFMFLFLYLFFCCLILLILCYGPTLFLACCILFIHCWNASFSLGIWSNGDLTQNMYIPLLYICFILLIKCSAAYLWSFYSLFFVLSSRIPYILSVHVFLSYTLISSSLSVVVDIEQFMLASNLFVYYIILCLINCSSLLSSLLYDFVLSISTYFVYFSMIVSCVLII